jgi:hypothetical protein
MALPPTTLLAGLLLEQCKNQGHDDIVIHHRPSTCTSTASA